MMRFACPHCKASVSAPEDKVGVRVYCPRCRQPFQVPAPPGAPKPPSVVAPPATPPPAPPATPTAVASAPTIPPTPTIPRPKPPAEDSPPEPPSRRSGTLLAFAAGLVIGALVGGGVVWAILARKWGLSQ